MFSSIVKELGNPDLVARIQKFCGVELREDADDCAGWKTRDAEATRRREDSDSGVLSKRLDSARRLQSDRNINGNNNNEKGCSDIGENSNKEVSSHSNDFLDRNSYDDGSVSRGAIYDGDSNPMTVRTSDRYPSIDNESISADGLRPRTADSAAMWKQCSCCDSSGFVSNGCVKSSGSTADLRGKSATRVVIRYPFLYYCARVGAFLGNEEFYVSGLPLLLWAMDSAVMRQTVVMWWLVMYLGQAGKDYLGWPRPPSPPVVRLETEHLDEFSMPSTHAMAGTAIPLLLATLLLERYQLPVIPVVCVAVLWFTTTCFSRLYLGVHTVLDLVGGAISALAVYACVSPLMARYDLYQQTHLLAPPVLIATSLALCTVLYPSPNKGAARCNAIIITSVVVGLGIGSWLNYQLGFSEMAATKPQQLPASAPTLAWLGTVLLQLVVGVTVSMGVKAIAKVVTLRLFSIVFGLDRVDPEHPNVMIGYKYTSYLCLGLAISFLAPLLFTALGFGRPGYYQEVL